MTAKFASTRMGVWLVASVAVGWTWTTASGTSNALTGGGATVQLAQAIGEELLIDPAPADPPEVTATPQPPNGQQAPPDSQKSKPFEAPAAIG